MTTTSLVTELNALHAQYVVAVNEAVSADDLDRAEQLAEGYDQEATALVAEREGRTDLLPLVRQKHRGGALHVLARLTRRTAA